MLMQSWSQMILPSSHPQPTKCRSVSIRHKLMLCVSGINSIYTTKTKTVSVNCKIPPLLLLNNKPLGSSPSETHVGIARIANNTNIETVKKRVKCARQTSYSLMGAGLHGLNGTGPMVAMIQYNTYVVPTLLYGLEALVLRTDEIQPLDKFHRKCLRYIQHRPQSTANCALYLLLGVLPIEAQIHIKVLNFFRNIIDEENKSPPSEYMRDIIIRQLAMKEDESSSWVAMVKKLLRIYGLPSAYTLLENTPKKRQWKKTLNEAVWSHWQKELKEEANTMSTMEFLNIDACQAGKLHPVWRNTTSQRHPEGNCQSPALSKTVPSLNIEDSWKEMEQHLPIV